MLDDIEKLCSRIVIINKGKILYQGGISEFLKKTDKQFEVVSSIGDKVVRETASTISEVMAILKTIEQKNGKLISVQEPKMALEQAYTEFRKQVQA